MIRPFIASLALAALVSFAGGGAALAAKKKTTAAPTMDGAILVVDAIDGPMPAGEGPKPVWTPSTLRGLVIVPHATMRIAPPSLGGLHR